MTERFPRVTPGRLRRVTVLAITGLIVLAGAGTAYARVSSSGPAYRLASATAAQVTASLDVVGTLEPLQQADVPFPVSGTVASVVVRAGQRVIAGQKLGSLSQAPLKAAISAAQSTLAQANLQVGNDTASQDQAASAAGSLSGPGPGKDRAGIIAGEGFAAAAASAAGSAWPAEGRPCAVPGQGRAGPGQPGLRATLRARREPGAAGQSQPGSHRELRAGGDRDGSGG